MRSYLSLNFPQSGLLVPSHQSITNHHSPSAVCFKLWRSGSQRYGRSSTRGRFLVVATMDWDSMSSFSLDDRVDSDGSIGYTFSSSEGEESDGDVILNPITDVDIPTSSERFRKPDDTLTATAHELGMLGKSHKRSGLKYGIIINIGLVTFLMVFLLLLDSHAWRIVRLPLPPFHLICPFTASAILVAFAGYICVPLFRISKMRMIINKWPARHSSSKKGTTTMGGLFLIPIGVVVAEVLVGFSSIEVAGASIATLAFATIGLIDDFLCLVKRRRIGLSPWIRILLESLLCLEHQWQEPVLVFFFITGIRLLCLWVILELWHWVGPSLQWLLLLECSFHYLFRLVLLYWKHYPFWCRCHTSRPQNVCMELGDVCLGWFHCITILNRAG